MYPIILAAILLLHGSHSPVLASKNFSQTDRAGVRELKGRLIKQLPKMPVYQGAKVSRSYEKREASKVGYEGTWTVGAPIAEVAAWYRRMLPRLGWKILEHNEGDDEQNMLIQKGGRNAYLWVERKGNVTEITVEFPMAPEVR